MRGGALPPALMCAALGFALSFAPRRTLGPAGLALAVAALAASRVTIDPACDDAVFLGCWISVILTACAVHLRGRIGGRLAVAMALNAGIWTGGVIAAAGAPADLLKALPPVLICLPGAWLTATGRSIMIKVAASWLVAVSILAASLSVGPTIPGYEPDHLE